MGGIKTNYKLAGDFDLWMRFSRCEKLYVTNALIGGFRHSEDQLSKNLDVYFREVDDIIARENISPEEHNQIKMIERNKRIVSFLKMFKILNWQALNSRITTWVVEEERRHRIYFDFERKQFVLPE